MSLKFKYTILYVNNVAATLDFFLEAFGLTPRMVHQSGDYAELATGDTLLAFSSVSLMKGLGKSPSAPKPDHPTFEIAFEARDVHSAYERAVKAGARPVQPPRDEAWGQTTSYVCDPEGFLIEICSPVRAT